MHSISTSTLMLGFVFSTVGLGYFVYGKKQGAPIPFFCGIVLMLLPYFVNSALWMTLAGLAIGLAPFFFRT